MARVPLLDLGNVVVKVSFAPFLSWLAERAREQDRARVEALLGSSLFFDFESGQISREGFAQRLSRLYQADFHPSELEERFCGIFPGLVEGMEPLIEELAQEGPVYCLTNTNEMHLDHLRERFPVMGRFARVFASHELGKRKPYPGIYRDVASELEIKPRELVFFDDLAANVAGAQRAGLEAHLFGGAEGLRGAFKKISVKDDNDQGGGKPDEAK